MAPVIEVERLTKEFQLGSFMSLGQSLRGGMRRLRGLPAERRLPFKALDDVSFAVNEGEVVGIIGHNGAGKSTLLKALANITRPTRGRVLVDGRIAPLIEVGAGFVPDFTGRENVYLNASILGMGRAEIKRRFDEIVAFADMAEFIDTPVKRYSSGMQVKLAFAVATSIEADILIVDEVLAVGDLAFQRKCFDRMEELIRRQQRTVLLVSHNIRQVERLCSRVLMLDRGRVAEDGAPRGVCNRFYEAMDRVVAHGALQTPQRRESTGDLDLESLTVLDRFGKPVQSCRYGDPLTVEVELLVHRPVRSPSLGIGVHTTDLLHLANNQSLEELPLSELQPGRHRIHFDIASFPFLPGVYSFRLGVALGGSFQGVFYAENLAQIVVTDETVNRAMVSQRGEGFVALKGAWQYCRETPRQPEEALA